MITLSQLIYAQRPRRRQQLQLSSHNLANEQSYKQT